MVFTGTFHRSLDDKLRFALPKDFRLPREGEETALYLTPGTDGSLSLYPEAAFQAFARRLASHSPTRRDVRTFRRLFYSQAQQCVLDRQGRLRISQGLAQLAGLKSEVVLLGVGEHIELWEPERWRQFNATELVHYDAFAEDAMAEDGLAGEMFSEPRGTSISQQRIPARGSANADPEFETKSPTPPDPDRPSQPR